jgi:hypothetical protein
MPFTEKELLRPEPFQVDFIGFGMILIKRKVLVRLVAIHGDNVQAMFMPQSTWKSVENAKAELQEVIRRQAAGELPLVTAMSEIERIQLSCPSLGEDYAFCKRARDAGFEIWCDPAFDVIHYGEYGYGRLDWAAETREEAAKKKREEEAEGAA